DNGIVGLAIAHDKGGRAWEIDSFLMSCRVIGRTVETTLLATLLERVRRAGATKIGGWFIPTNKNAPAKDFYRQHKFSLVAEEDGRQAWEMDLTTANIDAPPWVKRFILSEAPA